MTDITDGDIFDRAARAGIGMLSATPADEWPIEIDEDVEILVVHPNLAFAVTADEIRCWLAWYPAKWIDHNGGGWTWHGMLGEVRFVRPLVGAAQ